MPESSLFKVLTSWGILALSLLQAQAQVMPQAGLSYWYPNLYNAAPSSNGYPAASSSGGYSAVSSPYYQYQHGQYQYPTYAYGYPCYYDEYPSYPYPDYPKPVPVVPGPMTTTTPRPPPGEHPYTVFARHSLTQDETMCPRGTETQWNGFSFSQVAYGDRQDGPGADLGSYRSCYRDIATLVPYLKRNYTAYWLNSDIDSTSTTEPQGSPYNFSPYISRCNVCSIRAQITTVHSFTEETPSCPYGWYRLWNGSSFAQGQSNPVTTSREAYDRMLVSPGSCLEKFKAKPFIRCPGQGYCNLFSSAYGYWIPAAGSRHTISRCSVCSTQPIGKPDPYTGIPTTSTTTRPTRRPSSTTTRKPTEGTTTTQTSTTTTATSTTEVPSTTTSGATTTTEDPTTPSTITTTPITVTIPSTTTTSTTTTASTTTSQSTTTTTTPTTTTITTTTTTEESSAGPSTTTEEPLPEIPDVGE